MSETTQIILLKKHGGTQVMKMTKQPITPPADDEVQIDQKAIGLNFIDIYCRTGLYQHPLPHGLGFEAAGFVIAVGKKAKKLFKVGDRVAYAQGPLGAYAKIRNVKADRLVHLPDEISFSDAAASMLKGLTVQYLFRQVYRLQGHETILFHAAAGGVGLIACQWAKALGVKLIGTVSSPEKASLARKMGAWKIIDYTCEDVVDQVLKLTKKAKVPVVYDSVGADTWLTSLECVQPRGLLVSFGNASGPVTGVNLGILANKGSIYVTRPKLADFVPTQEKLQAAADELFDHMINGRIKANVHQEYTMQDIAHAHIALENRLTVGSTVIIP